MASSSLPAPPLSKKFPTGESHRVLWASRWRIHVRDDTFGGTSRMTNASNQGHTSGDDREVLTNRQGHPVYDNQSQRTVGERGPATLENYQFLEKISHFDRERIPERVVHARGTTRSEERRGGQSGGERT